MGEVNEETSTHGGTRAACFGLTEAFYGPTTDLREEPQDDREAREDFCKTVCAACSIRWECLSWALNEEDEWGVWGGMAFRERERFLLWLRKEGYEVVPQFHLLEELLEEFREHEEAEKRKRERKSEIDKLEAQAKERQKHVRRLPVPKVVNLDAARRRARSFVDGNGSSRVGRGAHPSSAQVQDVPGDSRRRAQGSTSRAASAGQVQGRRRRTD